MEQQPMMQQQPIPVIPNFPTAVTTTPYPTTSTPYATTTTPYNTTSTPYPTTTTPLPTITQITPSTTTPLTPEKLFHEPDNLQGGLKMKTVSINGCFVNNEKITFFIVQTVFEGELTVSLEKRFQNFVEFRDVLGLKDNSFPHAPFPQKMALACTGKKLEKRQAALDLWLKAVLHAAQSTKRSWLTQVENFLRDPKSSATRGRVSSTLTDVGFTSEVAMPITTLAPAESVATLAPAESVAISPTGAIR